MSPPIDAYAPRPYHPPLRKEERGMNWAAETSLARCFDSEEPFGPDGMPCVVLWRPGNRRAPIRNGLTCYNPPSLGFRRLGAV